MKNMQFCYCNFGVIFTLCGINVSFILWVSTGLVFCSTSCIFLVLLVQMTALPHKKIKRSERVTKNQQFWQCVFFVL